MKTKTLLFLSILIVASLALSACAVEPVGTTEINGVEYPLIPAEDAEKWCKKNPGATFVVPGSDLIHQCIGEAEEPAGAPAEPSEGPVDTTGDQPVPNACRDGEVIGNIAKDSLSRLPIGLGENNAIVEMAWQPGSGLGGWDRVVLVVPTMGTQYQVFALGDVTAHMLRYCGTLSEVQNYAAQDSTHIWAMRQTAANSAGVIPGEEEIGAYAVDFSTGGLVELNAAADGPSVETIMEHLEIVTITGVGHQTSDAEHAGPFCDTTNEVDLGPWAAQDRVVTGPAIVDIGFPAEGNTMYHVLVENSSVTFVDAAGKAWNMDSACSSEDLKAEWERNPGRLQLKTVDELVTAGKATK